MRLIDGNKALREVERIPFIVNENKAFHEGCRYMQKKVLRIFHESKAIEAEPVKHGNWLWDGKHYYCSVCSGTRYHDLVLGMDAAYCPYCGAKLGGVEDGKK